jgi:hypothetical protein
MGDAGVVPPREKSARAKSSHKSAELAEALEM